MDKIKYCPICGGYSKFNVEDVVTVHGKRVRCGYISCTYCGLATGDTLKEEDCIKKWNTRLPVLNTIRECESKQDEMITDNVSVAYGIHIAINIVRNMLG